MDKIAYFDNAATTFPKPEDVYEFVDYFYRNYGVNVGRGQHKLAAKAYCIMEETRDMLLELFHCPAKQVVYTNTATEALNIIVRGLQISDNCNIYISPFEHNSVTRILNHIKKHFNINVFELSVDKKTLKYDVEAIKTQFSINKPHVMIISHASNICGVVAPVLDLCRISKKYNSINVIDMCQTAGLVDIDLSDMSIDFAVFDGHKTLYAPFGVAGIISAFNIKPEPLLYGGTGVDSANQELPEILPQRYEVASHNIMAISGLNASLKWIKKVGIENIYKQEQQNYLKLIEILSRHTNIHVISPDKDVCCIGVVSCVFDGYSSDDIAKVLSENNIAVRAGLHCAPIAHKFLGTFPAGTVRFSVSYFNNDNDFELLDKALNYIEENA